MDRKAEVKRVTKETDIYMNLKLDGEGKSCVDTGIGFFNHMLEGFSKHGFFDLEVTIKGDLDVDGHHTVEDAGIVLGSAIKEAVGDKKGIRRHNHFIFSEVSVHRRHIHRDIPLIKIFVAGMNLPHVGQIHRGSAGILQRPVIFPVEKDAHLRLVDTAQDTVSQTLQLCSQLRHLPKYPGVFRPRVGDHRPVEFLAAAHASPQLEELDRIPSVGQGLIALGPHLSRPL